MSNTIKCPNCGKPVEISKALRAQIESDVLANAEEKFHEELEKVRKETLLDANKKLEKQFSLELKRAKEEAEENEVRNKLLIDQVTDITKQMRRLKIEKDEVALDMQKKLAVEEEKIRLDAMKKAEESQHGKIREMEKQLQDALKSNQDLERKLTQGSQQLQGEAFELEFEEMLKRQYPNDQVKPVGKGIRGGDVIHEVWDSRGNYVGKILWELKNTKTWSELWVDKLKADQRSVNAEEAVLITEILPTDMKTAGFRKNIWVTKRNFVVPLTDTLRAKLIQMYHVKKSVEGKDEKMEILYSYLSGTEFKHRVEAIVDAFTKMQEEIEKEKRYFMNKWARDEKNIRQVIDNTYGMHGDLKGIIGNMLPQIKGLELLDGLPESVIDGENTEQTKLLGDN